MRRWSGLGIVPAIVLAISVALSPMSAAPALADASGATAGTVANVQRALDEGRYLDAGRMLDGAILGGGDDPRLMLLTGELALARGAYSDALARFRRVEGIEAVRARALEGEGLVLSIQGQPDAAIAALNAAVALDPNSWRSWNGLGAEYDRRRDWQKADMAYANALAHSARSPQILNNRGFSYLSRGEPDKAIADFVAALDARPDMQVARNNLRLAIAMKGDYRRAVAGISRDPAADLNNAGFAAILRGDYAHARSLLGEAIKARNEYYALAAANLQMVNTLDSGGEQDSGRAARQ